MSDVERMVSAADRIESAAHRMALLFEDGYGGNGVRLLEAVETNVADLRAKLQAAEELIGMLNEIADDYAQHDSWRCGYYDECHCGLNELQKLAGMELSPCGYNKQEPKP